MRLGDLERRVMEIVWAHLGEQVTAREVADDLPGYAYTTVLTVLDRLERKGLVQRERGGRAHLYAATASRESYVAELMRDALGSAADRDAALVHFAETASASDAATLRRVLSPAAPLTEEPPTMIAGLALTALAVVLFGPAGPWLARSGWPSRAPRAAIVLWQAIGLAGALAAIGAGLAVTVAPLHGGLLGGALRLVRQARAGHPLAGLGIDGSLGLTVATDVGAVLLVGLVVATIRTARTRAVHRRVLDLVGRQSERAPGALLLDDVRAAAYCLPGMRPRIVVSAGTLEILDNERLAAVLAHERGHARERHGIVLLPFAAMDNVLRFIPYAAPRPAGGRWTAGDGRR